MNDLLRELAPISSEAWKDIEEEATRLIQRKFAEGYGHELTRRECLTGGVSL